MERAEDDPLRPGRRTRRSAAARQRPRPSPPRWDPSPAALAETAGKRETLRRMWTDTVPIATPGAAARYLEGRGIPLAVATAARVRFAADWYGREAVLFPVQDAAGTLVAAEGRHTDGRADPKGHTAGPKSHGVFEAMPRALFEADGVTLCEGPITALSVAAGSYPAAALCGRTMPAWLPARLALHTVLVSLDWVEEAAEKKAAPIFRQLAALGCSTYRLSPPAGTGDWNDYLRAVGRDAMRAELERAICGALAPHT